MRIGVQPCSTQPLLLPINSYFFSGGVCDAGAWTAVRRVSSRLWSWLEDPAEKLFRRLS